MYLPTALPFVSLQRYSNAPTASHSLIHIFHQLKSPRILWSFQNSTDPEEHLYLNKGKCTHSANRKPKLNSLLHLTGRKNKVPAVFHETALKSRLAGYSGENSVAPLSFCSILHGKEKRKLWPRLIAKDKTDTTENATALEYYTLVSISLFRIKPSDTRLYPWDRDQKSALRGVIQTSQHLPYKRKQRTTNQS